MGHAVGVLADDHVAFFQAQQALGLDAERANAQPRAGLHQGIPQALGVARRHVHFVAQFTHKAHPQDARGNAGHCALTYAEVREGLGRQVHIVTYLGQHLA